MKGLTYASQEGASLIEILIATAIFSIGLLTFIALQGKSFELSNDGYFKTQAVIVVDEIVEKLKSQSIVSVNTTVTTDTTTFNTTGILKDAYQNQNWAGTITVPANDNCSTSTCDFQEMTVYNASEFKNSVSQSLPSGSINIFDCLQTNPSDKGFCIAVSWKGKDVAECDGQGNDNEDNCYIQFVGL